MSDFADEEFMAVASPVWQFVLRFGLGTILALFYVTASLHFQYTPDDTYIYLQYARNLAHGDGFAFNAGIPSNGVTGPLWVFLIAAGVKMSLDPYIVAKTLDLVFASLSVLLAHMVTFLLTRDRVYAIVGALLVAADASVLRWAGSGMEVSMTMFLLLLTVRYVVTREYTLAAFGSGLLILLSPEGAIVALLVLALALRQTIRRQADGKRFGWTVLFLAMPLVSWIVYAWTVFGTLVPNARTWEGTGSFAFGTAGATLFADLQSVAATQAVAVAVLVVGMGFVVSMHGMKVLWEEAAPLLVIPAIVVVIMANGTAPSRAIIPYVALIPVYALWSLKVLERRSRWSLRRSAIVLACIVVFAMTENVVVFTTRIVPHVVRLAQGMEECLKPIGFWLRNNTKPEATVVARDVGMIGYISERRIYDTPGVITPGLRRVFGSIRPDSAIAMRAYERVISPDYVIDRSSIRERLAAADLRPVLTREFPDLGTPDPGVTYVTVYEVIR